MAFIQLRERVKSLGCSKSRNKKKNYLATQHDVSAFVKTFFAKIGLGFTELIGEVTSKLVCFTKFRIEQSQNFLDHLL